MSTCDLTYSVLLENFEYVAQAAYMVPAAILYMRILYVIWVKHRNVYSRHPFFVIYSMDSTAGLLLLLLDIFITRLFAYFPQLCRSGSKFFLSHSYIMDLYYPFFHYFHCAQPLIQIFLTTNRMTSVLFPIHHDKYWQPKLPFVFLIVALTPIPFIWSTIISPKDVVFFFGGFLIIGTSAVKTILLVLFVFSRILYLIWVKYRNIYSRHPFFVIYSMDCAAGLLLLLQDIFITRLFVYFPQLCLSGSEFFLSHSYMDFYYPFLHYLHCTQPLIQIFLTTNRMTSVLFPVHHDKYWERKLPFVFLFIALTPIPCIWSTITAPKDMAYFFGGFLIIGTSAVKTILLVLFVFRSVAVGITIITTFIMYYRMSRMTNRLKKSERTLCLACTINSVCFMVPSFFEALTTFYEPYRSSKIRFIMTPLSWDFLNVGSPVIMIFVSTQLRRHVFSLSEPQPQTAPYFRSKT